MARAWSHRHLRRAEALTDRLRALGALCLALTLVACSSAVRWEDPSGTHVVSAGETLYSIAWRYGLDYRQLAAWNQLGDGTLIFPGQRLRLTPPQALPRTPPAARSAGSAAPPATAGQAGGGTAASPSGTAQSPAAVAGHAPGQVPGSDWAWPTGGTVKARFGATPTTQSGIQIGGRRGQPVRAAAAGEVVYAGGGLPGYGQLLILKHDDTWLSAYGHNDELLVREGQRVRQGEEIARMGLGPGAQPMLHFEIRRNGAPLDPLRLLPRP